MTTVAIVRKNGAVGLAADTLSKDGSTMLRARNFVNHSKIIQLGDSLVSYTGTGSWEHVLPHYFSRLKKAPDLSSVDAIFDTLLRMHRALKNYYNLNPNDDDDEQFVTSRFCLLIANSGGGFVVFPDRAISEVNTFYALGAGFNYALGAMHVAYQFVSDPADIAKMGVEAAAEFDEDTALPIEVRRVELAKGKA